MPILTLKMVDSALEKNIFLIYTKNWLDDMRSKPSYAHCKDPKQVSPLFWGGRPLQNSRKTNFDPEGFRV
jgi:hypothetical protein